jgi:hypothetical protein
VTASGGPLRRHLLGITVLSVLVLAVVCVVAYRLEPGESRSPISIVSLFITGLSVIVAVVAVVQNIPQGPTGPRIVRPFDPSAIAVWARRHKGRAWLAGIALALVVVSVPLTIRHYTTVTAIVVTGDIEARDVAGLGDGSAATLVLPGTPPERDHITLVPTITNPAATGSCVDPALLVVTPHVDGQPGESVTVRSGEPAEVSLEGAASRASVTVEVDQSQGDTGGLVDLHIERAVLHG